MDLKQLAQDWSHRAAVREADSGMSPETSAAAAVYRACALELMEALTQQPTEAAGSLLFQHIHNQAEGP